MTTAARVIEIARAQIGVTESPANSNCNPYSKALGRPCEYWCADGVSWVFREAGLTERPNTASTRAMRDWFVARNAFNMNPQPGDAGLMHLTGRNGAGQPDHVGIVASVNFNTSPVIVQTIEFNTSATDAGSQDNGGGVYPKSRRLGLFVGFGHPAFATGEEWLMGLTADQITHLGQMADDYITKNRGTALGQVLEVIQQWRGEKGDTNPGVKDLYELVKEIHARPAPAAGGGMNDAQAKAIVDAVASTIAADLRKVFAAGAAAG